jgi:hypothetical protein
MSRHHLIMMVTSRRSLKLTMSFKMRHSPTHLKRQGVSQELSPRIYIFVCNIPFRCLPVSVDDSLSNMSMDASYSNTFIALLSCQKSLRSLAIFITSFWRFVGTTQKQRYVILPFLVVFLPIVNVNGRSGVINNTALFFLSKPC